MNSPLQKFVNNFKKLRKKSYIFRAQAIHTVSFQQKKLMLGFMVGFN